MRSCDTSTPALRNGSAMATWMWLPALVAMPIDSPPGSLRRRSTRSFAVRIGESSRTTTTSVSSSRMAMGVKSVYPTGSAPSSRLLICPWLNVDTKCALPGFWIRVLSAIRFEPPGRLCTRKGCSSLPERSAASLICRAAMSSAAPGPDDTIHSRLREGFHSPAGACACAGPRNTEPSRIAGTTRDNRTIAFFIAVRMLPPEGCSGLSRSGAAIALYDGPCIFDPVAKHAPRLAWIDHV